MRRLALLLVLLAIIGGFDLSTIRRGNFWGDDYALYIHHAENIAEHRPYADTGYIYNPQVPVYGPRIYPPVFPLLLAPVYKILGLNLIWMKREQVAFLLLALAGFYAYWKNDLDFRYLLGLIAIFGFNPHVWELKDSVVSDLPFLFFFFLAAWLMRFGPRRLPGWWRWAILAGVSLYCCVGTRSIGVALIAGWVIYDVIKSRKVTVFTATALLVCGVFLILQRYITGPGQGSYADQFHPTLAGVAGNAARYLRTLGFFWMGSGRVLTIILCVTMSVLAGIGLCLQIKRGLTVLETCLLPYLALVVLWPSFQGLRFLLPLIAFYLYLAMLGFSRVTASLPKRFSMAAFAALLLLIAVSYVSGYRHVNYGTIPQADGLPSFNDLCRAVREQTKPDDAIIFRRPRVLSLFTSRPASVYAPSGDADLWSYTQSIHAAYIVSSELFEDDRAFLIPFAQRNAARLELVYQNADFRLYRVRPAGAELPPRPN